MRTVLLALVGFAVGWIGVVSLQGGANVDAPDPVTPEDIMAPERPEVTARPEVTERPEATTEADQVAPAADPFWSLEPREQFDELVRRHEVPDAVRVPNRVFGRVVDVSGYPRRGIELELTPFLRPLDVSMPPLEPAEFIRRRLRDAAWAKEHRQVTVTDDNGEFDVGDLIAASYRVSVVDGTSASSVVTEPGAWCEIREWPRGTRRIDLRVEDEAGTPVASVIAVRHPDTELLKLLFELQELRRQSSNGYTKMLAPLQGRRAIDREVVRDFLAVPGMEFAVPPVDGESELTLGWRRAARDWPDRWEWVWWDGSDDQLVLVRERLRIDLEVRLFPGCENSVGDVAVLALGEEGPVGVDEFVRRARWQSGLAGVPCGPNTIRVPIDVPRGLVQIGVVLGDPNRSALWVHRPPANPTAVDALETFDIQSSDAISIDVPEPRPDGGYVIEVVDASGRSVPGMRKARLGVGRAFGVTVTPIRISSGEYVVRPPDRIFDQHEKDELRYELTLDGYPKVTGTLPAGRSRRIEHQLEPGSSLTIRVREPDQRDSSWVPEVRVSVQHETLGRIREGQIGTKRVLELDDVPSGIVTVRGMRVGSGRLFEQEIALDSESAHEIEIELPTLHPLAVDFRPGAPHRVDLREAAGGRVPVRAGWDVMLPAGTYEVVPPKEGLIEKPGHHGTVRVPGDDRITIIALTSRNGEE